MTSESIIVFELEGDGRRPGPMVSASALRLHVGAVSASARTATPGYVSHAYLASVSGETTFCAVELCLERLWKSVEGGYLVLDQDFLDQVVAIIAKDRKNQRLKNWFLGPHPSAASCAD